MSSIRKEVLSSFKNLHRARQQAFKNDNRTLEAARLKINEEYKRNKNLEDSNEVNKAVKLAVDVEKEIRSNLIQAEETKPGYFALHIKDETLKLDNTLFDPNAELPSPRNIKCK